MRITYVLPHPELNGGNKVIFQHVALLREHGDEITVLAEGPKPDWIRIDAAYHDTAAAVPPRLADQDLVVATYWTTLAPAVRLAAGPVAHFCQGYEGGLVHLAPLLPQIEAAYAMRLPALTVSPHLAELLKSRFGRESRIVPPPLDPLFRPSRVPWRLRARKRPWIAVPGIFEAEVKGVPTALAAVRLLAASGLRSRLLRFSGFPLEAAERDLRPPDLYLHNAPPAAVAQALRRCDLLLFPSRPEEGFGLPLLEAMASGVPAVASRIPSAVQIAGEAAALVPVADAEAFAAAAGELLGNGRAWRRARRRGLHAARRFRSEAVAPRLVEAVHWARDWALRYPPES